MKVEVTLGSNFYCIEDIDSSKRFHDAIVDIPEEKIEEYKYIFEEYNKCLDEICKLVKEQDPKYWKQAFLGYGYQI